MNLDTQKLKAKVEGEINRLREEKESLLKQVEDLDAERTRLNGTYETIESVERIARDLENIVEGAPVPLHNVESPEAPSPSPDPEPAADPAPLQEYGDKSEEFSDGMVQDFKQWA